MSRKPAVLPAGKLPANLLRRLIRSHGYPDPAVLIGPRYGEDAAVVDLGQSLLVLKTDPVTFATSEVGAYAVHVNANDVAVMGARPRWFQATVLLPEGASPSLAQAIFRQIDRTARSLRIAVTGGHTEVTPAVSQPVVVGDLQGLTERKRLVTSTGARPGDVLLLTKEAGLEGTAIIAAERANAVRSALGNAGLRAALRLRRQPGISVVAEALAAARLGATAMHDPTEGGVAAALDELARASRCQLDVDLDAIPVRRVTAQICQHFGICPLGLLSSGALLVTIPQGRLRALRARLRAMSIPVALIGRVQRGRGVAARRGGRRVSFEARPQDELTRLV